MQLLHYAVRAIIPLYPKQHVFMILPVLEPLTDLFYIGILFVQCLWYQDSRVLKQMWLILMKFFALTIFIHAYCGPCGVFAYKQIIPDDV